MTLPSIKDADVIPAKLAGLGVTAAKSVKTLDLPASNHQYTKPMREADRQA
jgi:hypothetical protein